MGKWLLMLNDLEFMKNQGRQQNDRALDLCFGIAERIESFLRNKHDRFYREISYSEALQSGNKKSPILMPMKTLYCEYISISGQLAIVILGKFDYCHAFTRRFSFFNGDQQIVGWKQLIGLKA